MRYPFEPGARAGLTPETTETSRQAADAVAPTAARMVDRIADLLASGPRSPEELTVVLAADSDAPVLLTSVRARCTQLHKQGRARPSGSFGVGESNRIKTIRWRLSTPEELAEFQAARRADWIARQEGAR